MTSLNSQLNRTIEAIKADPKFANVHWNLAGLLEKRDDFDGAIREIREYIRKGDPDNDGEARLAKLLKKKPARSQARFDECVEGSLLSAASPSAIEAKETRYEECRSSFVAGA